MAKKSRKQAKRTRQKNHQRKQRQQTQQQLAETEVTECLPLGESLDQDTAIVASDVGEWKPSLRPSGLPNMGNTCYFNSVMQVLGQTYLLHELLTERCQDDFTWHAKTFYLKDSDGKSMFASENLRLKLPPPSALVKHFLQLQESICQQKSTNPRPLLAEIRRDVNQFVGFAQQDSHELLIELLDLLKKTERSRQIKALIQGLEIKNPKNATEEEKAMANRYRVTSRHTVIDALFGGHLLTIIFCTVCRHRSFIFEPFIGLSLPLKYHESVGPIPSAEHRNRKQSEGSQSGEEEEEHSQRVDYAEDEAKHLTPKQRRLRRQEKKAAKRKARQERLEENSSPDEKSEERPGELANGQVEESDKYEEKEESRSEHSGDAERESSSSESDESDGQEKSEEPKRNGHLASDSGSGKEENSDGESYPCLDEINDEFRSKFYAYVHQRMSYSDEQYDNQMLGLLFRSFIREESLDGSNKYLCENCSKSNEGKKTYTKAIRCQLIALPPPVLLVHLKRFEVNPCRRSLLLGSMQKLNSSISFPEHLYLSPYTSRIYEYFSRFYEPNCDPEQMSAANERRLEYRLYGVVLHSGTLRSGHYMAYVCVRPDRSDSIRKFLHLKPFVSNIEHILSVYHQDCGKSNSDSNSPNPSASTSAPCADDDRKWYFVSDSSVSQTTLSTVLSDTTSPYLLFYERTG